jgi:hypothetical protein
MQDYNQNLKGKESASSQHTKEFYNTSILKPNSIAEICHEITSTEAFDHNVERAKNILIFSF